jgi:TonB family protein
MFAAITLLIASTAEAQNALGPARDLYASAAYEEALTALNRLKIDADTDVAPEIDRYRALCLMALGRASEAEKVIESIVMTDPLYQPAAVDEAPRMRAAFSAVRQRMLPNAARKLYVEAKELYDRKAYLEAAQTLERVLRVIDTIEPVNQAELGDLRMLGSGFLELSRAALAPPPPPAPAVATTAALKVEPAPSPALPQSTGLVVLNQALPPLPFSLAKSGTREFRGRVEVDIDASGNVSDVRILERVHVLYDPLLLEAARHWKYEPPRVDGKPTPTRKRVSILLRP